MSFRDTFTREESSDSNFDDSAFLFFVGALVLVVAIYLTCTFFTFVFYPTNVNYPKKSTKGSEIQYCETSSMRKKRVQATPTSLTVATSKTGIIRLVVLVTLWSGLSYLAMSLGSNPSNHIKGFNPFELLEVTPGASEGDIKRQYRKMSLKYHPDKNPNDPLAAAMFIRVTKAYAALTDETARKNYEKYGNPDGPVNMQVGIGLPSVFLVKENQVLFLVAFFLLLLVFVPLLFILYYQRTKMYEANGVMVETLKFFGFFLTESIKPSKGIELLSCSAEARMIKLRLSDDGDMKKLTSIVGDLPKSNSLVKQPQTGKCLLLLNAHMKRLHDKIPESLKSDLEQFLSVTPAIVSSMIDIALVREFTATAMALVEMSRCLVQAIEPSDSSLLQIPGFDSVAVGHATKGKNKVSNLAEFLRAAPTERKGLADFTDEQRAELALFEKHIGNQGTTFTVRAHVDDEEDSFFSGDIVTIEVSMDRPHIEQGKAAGPVHAPFFPVPKFETWYLFLVEAANNHVLLSEKIKSCEKTAKVDLKFRLGKPGPKSFNVVCMSDSYAGIDVKLDVSFKVQAEQTKEMFVHPEDADLDKHPTLFQQMMGAQLIEDEDESDQEDEDNNKKTQKPSKPVVAAVEDSDEDSN
jgi:translocation protein SEC63